MAQVEAGPPATSSCTSPARISLSDISELPLDVVSKLLPRRKRLAPLILDYASIRSSQVQAVDRKRKLEGPELAALQPGRPSL